MAASPMNLPRSARADITIFSEQWLKNVFLTQRYCMASGNLENSAHVMWTIVMLISWWFCATEFISTEERKWAWNDSIVEHFCENHCLKALQSTTDTIHFQFETSKFCENSVCTIFVQMIIFNLIMEMLILSLVFILREIIWKYSTHCCWKPCNGLKWISLA